MWRNRVLIDIYEFGLIFKIVIAAVGFEEGVVNENF